MPTRVDKTLFVIEKNVAMVGGDAVVVVRDQCPTVVDHQDRADIAVPAVLVAHRGIDGSRQRRVDAVMIDAPNPPTLEVSTVLDDEADPVHPAMATNTSTHAGSAPRRRRWRLTHPTPTGAIFTSPIGVPTWSGSSSSHRRASRSVCTQPTHRPHASA